MVIGLIMGKIAFYEEDVRLRYMKRIPARSSLMRVLDCLGCLCGEINYIFCSDGYLYQMNREYLNHDTLTDIITFDYTSENFENQIDFEFVEGFPNPLPNMCGEKLSSKRKTISGDIYISLDRVRENAEKFHVEQIDELNRVMVHGILHLAGYKDKKPAEEKRMHYMEDQMLAACFSGYEHLRHDD